MAWMIVCEDSAQGPALRADKALMAAHWDYELSIRDRILAAGSLRSDDGLTPNGSLLIVDAGTRDEAMALIEADPRRRPVCAAGSRSATGNRRSSTGAKSTEPRPDAWNATAPDSVPARCRLLIIPPNPMPARACPTQIRRHRPVTDQASSVAAPGGKTATDGDLRD